MNLIGLLISPVLAGLGYFTVSISILLCDLGFAHPVLLLSFLFTLNDSF